MPALWAKTTSPRYRFYVFFYHGHSSLPIVVVASSGLGAMYEGILPNQIGRLSYESDICSPGLRVIDKKALKIDLGASIIISMVILSINIMITRPYSILIQYLVAFFSYLLFVGATQTKDKKDLELIGRTVLGKMKCLTVPL